MWRETLECQSESLGCVREDAAQQEGRVGSAGRGFRIYVGRWAGGVKKRIEEGVMTHLGLKSRMR